MFLDEANVILESGKGGDGAATFHREKHVPRGGPNGANGGKGGDIVLRADRHKRTLYDFKLKDTYRAKDGEKAVGNKAGKDAPDVVIHVPVGTVVHDLDLQEPIADLAAHGMTFVVCRGGRGGMGNLHFTNSVRQSPKFAQKGAPSETAICRLELKLIAEVGLIGLPNAGKSTLLSRLSAAKPKIGDYPFTTIVPNLGVVPVGDHTFVMADLPGLIEGASEGVGLGHQFLRHAERNKVLLHLVDAYPLDGSDPLENFHLIENELRLYSQDLFERPRVVALNKSDIGIPEAMDELLEKFAPTGFPLHVVSGVSGEGLEPLKWALWKAVEDNTPEEEPVQILVPDLRTRDAGTWDVLKTEHGFEVTGKRIERLVAMTNLDNRDAVHYLYRKLRRIGVIEKLQDLGAQEGDTVTIGDQGFDYTDW